MPGGHVQQVRSLTMSCGLNNNRRNSERSWPSTTAAYEARLGCTDPKKRPFSCVIL